MGLCPLNKSCVPCADSLTARSQTTLQTQQCHPDTIDQKPNNALTSAHSLGSMAIGTPNESETTTGHDHE